MSDRNVSAIVDDWNAWCICNFPKCCLWRDPVSCLLPSQIDGIGGASLTDTNELLIFLQNASDSIISNINYHHIAISRAAATSRELEDIELDRVDTKIEPAN